MKKVVFIVAFAFTQLISYGQAPGIAWQECIGNLGGEVPNSMQPTADGGFIIAGRWGSYTLYNYYIIKVDSAGTVEWERSFGGDGDDQAYSIAQTADGGYIVAGSGRATPVVTGTFKGIWILKLDALGNQQWQTFMDVGAAPKRIQQTLDGGYILAGNKSFTARGSDFYIVKLNNVGSVIWTKNYGGAAEDYANDIKQTSDGGYIVAGQVYSSDGDVTGNHGNTDVWILKLDAQGLIEWKKTYGGTGVESANSIALTNDGGYVFAGFSNRNSGDVSGVYGNPDFWIVKINSTGTLLWQKAFGGDNFDEAYSIKPTIDGGYIVAGDTNSNNSGYIAGHHGIGLDFWIVKINATGVFQWQKALGGTSDDSANNVIQNNDGSYLITGVTYSNNGDVQTNPGVSLNWLVKLNPEVLQTESFDKNNVSIFPNPTKQFLNIQNPNNQSLEKVMVFDITGKIIKEEVENLYQINVQDLQKGLYFIQIQWQGKTITQKFIKE